MSSPGNEISLRDLILGFQDWVTYIKSKVLVVALAILIGGSLGYVYCVYSKPIYVGELRFVLSGNSSSNGLAGLAGLAGIDLNNSSRDGVFQGDNIIELLKSKKILRRALFQPVHDSSDVLINLVAEESGIKEKWLKSAYISRFLPFPVKENQLLPQQDSLFRELHGWILNKYLIIEKKDKKLSFYNVSTTTTNELVSALLTNNLVREATRFYVETKTKTAKDNLMMLQHEADSLRILLHGTVSSIARGTDRTFNLNPALQINRAAIQNNQVQAEVVGSAYAEVIKNLEIAKITLQKETPLVQIIDEPTLPLKIMRKSKLKYSVIGAVISSFIIVVFLVLYRLYKQTMSVNI